MCPDSINKPRFTDATQGGRQLGPSEVQGTGVFPPFHWGQEVQRGPCSINTKKR